MATPSTPSSGTDGSDPGTSSPAVEPGVPTTPSSVDAGRRAFFREFGKQAATAVGQVAGMADAVSRSASAMAGELLGLEDERRQAVPAFARSAAVTSPVVSATPPATEDRFHSAYRLSGDELVLLDQRGVPEALTEVVARRGSDVAYYLRLGLARGGPLMAQLAAYGLALTAAERESRPSAERAQELRRTEQALVDARPSARLLGWAVERMRAAAAAVADGTGEELAVRLRSEADTLAGDMAAWLATIAASIATELPRRQDRPLGVLLHGDGGALAGGLVGTAIPALAQLRDDGQEVRIFVTEGRPFMEGARLAAWELRQAGLEHKVLPDAAVAWLLEHEPIDAVLMSAERVAANGDIAALIGSRAVAAIVGAQPRGRRPRLLVSGPAATSDPGAPDGAAMPRELRPANELAAYLTGVPIRTSDALVPATDVLPASAVDLFVTEAGVIRREDA